MQSDIRKRIDKLKEINKYENDSDVINAIFQYKRSHGQTGRLKDFEYLDKSKGSFSQYFNGTRNFKEEDYLAIESVLNTSMAYIIEGKGEISESFKPKGIRYAAYTDTVGNYEELIREDILNSSDEYNKTLIDYIIEYKSKNGFIYFAERDLLPLNKCGGLNTNLSCLHYFTQDNSLLLKTLCELLPIKLLNKYFDGFLSSREMQGAQMSGLQLTSFTDDVLAEAIKREDLRKELARTREIDIDTFNRAAKRNDGSSFGKGLFVNYGLTSMLRYALTHDIENDVRDELLASSIEANRESLKYVSVFEEDELKIDKYGYITDKHEFMCYGSVVVPCEVSVVLSDSSTDLLLQLNREIHDFHELISNHSSIAAYGNRILADKKDNSSYYDFFKLMNDQGIQTIPFYREKDSKEKDLFEVRYSDQSRIANGTDETLKSIIKSLKEIDTLSSLKLAGKTYYLIDPSIYMVGGQVNYIMPKDVVVSSKYSNLIRLINNNAIWYLYDSNNKTKIKRFIGLIKAYGLEKENLKDFFEEFAIISEEISKTIDKTNNAGKEFALRSLENKAWINIYQEDIIKEF